MANASTTVGTQVHLYELFLHQISLPFLTYLSPLRMSASGCL